MYVLSGTLINYWVKNKASLYTKRAFIRSLGLDPGEYKFTSFCAFMWEYKGSACTTVSWDEFRKLSSNFVVITAKDYVNWIAGNNKEQKEKLIKKDKNVNRLQKQKTQIDRGDLLEGNRIKGRTCQITIGIGHLSYQAVKSWSWNSTCSS